MSALTLYRHPLSGHAHRAELFLSLLGIDAKRIDVDLLNGEHRKTEFLTKNPFGQVPILEDGDITVADSNAILVYLARKYDADNRWLPAEPEQQAKVQQYLSLAAGKIASGPAAARLVTLFGAPLDLDNAIRIAHEILAVLNSQLEGRTWLVGNQPTLADIACYSYIAHAPEGNVSLDAYPFIRQWLTAVEQLPGFIAMPSSKVGLNA